MVYILIASVAGLLRGILLQPDRILRGEDRSPAVPPPYAADRMAAKVVRACREAGISRTLYYRWNRR